MDIQAADRLRALWKSGRDKYRSFFTTLEEVRHEIGDEALPDWCFHNLHISFSVIESASKLIQSIDADKIRKTLAAAKETARQQRAAKLVAKRQQRDEMARQKEIAEASHAAELARLQAEKMQYEAECEKTENLKKRRESDRHNPAKRGPLAGAKRDRRRDTAELESLSLKDLMVRFAHGTTICEKGDAMWVEGSIIKAKVLCRMRELMSADQDFGKWASDNIPELSHQDRAALVGLGRLETSVLRELLTSSTSRCYQLIWRDYRPLKLVESD